MDVVYKIEYNDCNATYIGKLMQKLKTKFLITIILIEIIR